MTDTEGAPRRATIYERISSDPTGRLAGVERQDEDNRALAAQLGWDVVAVRRDNDVSAYSGKSRPGFKALLEDLREGRANAVIAWHPDRLYRRLPDLEELAKVVQANDVLIRTVRAGAVDLSTASGIMTAEILASVSKHEVAHAIERMTRAKAQAATEGRFRGGPRPFGFEPDGVTVRQSEAKWIVAATDAVINGETLSGICRTLAEHDVRTPERRFKQPDGSKGQPESRHWLPAQLRTMLLRGRNAGLVEAGGEVVGTAVWPAIVDEDRWRTCVAILSDESRRTITSNARVWLLSGVARCWCGSIVKCSTAGIGGPHTRKNPDDPNGDPIVVKRKGHIAAYRCRASNGHISRRAERLDAYIEGLALDRLSRPDAALLLRRPSPQTESDVDLASQGNALRAKLDEIAADYAADLLTRKQSLDATALTRARLEQVEAKMAARATESVLASIPLGTMEIVQAWKSYDIDKKRAIIVALMDITMLPAKRGRPKGSTKGAASDYFDDSALEVKWKRGDNEPE